MPLSILTDEQIGFLLDNLTLDELDGFSGCLKAALHEYSVGTQGKFSDDDVQPERQTIRSEATGTTTLFMPSRGPSGLGVKVITLSPPSNTKEGNSRQTSTPTGGDETVTYAVPSDGDIRSATSVVRPTGAITLFSPTGSPVALLHASQLTAFRTALASHCLVQRRETVRTLTVFGAGLQAYYHVRLALMSKGSTIKQVNVVSHRFSDSCRLLMKKFYSNINAETKLKEGWSNTKFSILTPAYVEYDRLLKEQVRAADVIFCCTPSTKELFPGSYLTNPEGRKKGRLVVAIGSYTPEMAELPVDLVRQATRRHEPWQHHFHRHAPEGGVIVVDTLDGALKEAGEIIAAGLKPSQLVELGEIVMLRRLKLAEQEEEQQQQRQRESADSVASGSTSALNSPLNPEFEKFDVTPGSSAMSSVFSSASSVRSGSMNNITLAGTAASSRSSSPGLGRKSSGSNNTTISFAPDNHPKRALSIGSSSSPSTTSTASRSSKKAEKDDQLARWLQTGNVIYKSVGLGLMDLAVGMHLVEFAREKGVGTHVDGF